MTRRIGHALLLVSACLLTAFVESRIDPSLFVTPGKNELIDPWIYTGFFLSLPSFMHRFPDTYYGSRLSVILPGFAAHSVLPSSPLLANYILHMTLFCALLCATYGLVRLGSDRGTAVLSTCVMAWNPIILSSISWDYVDGFGIVFLVVTLLCLEHAVQADRGRVWFARAAGITIACMLTANVFLITLLPILGVFLLTRTGRERWRVAAAIVCEAATGMLAAFAGFGLISSTLGGAFWFLRPQLRAVATLTAARNPWQLSSYSWLASATWLVLPAIATLGAALCVARWLRSRSPLTFEVSLQIVLLSAVSAWLAIQLWSTPVLQISYYSSYLGPLALLALSLQARAGGVDGAQQALLGLLTVGLFALGHWLMLSDAHWFWTATQPVGAHHALSRVSWIGPSRAQEAFATALALIGGCFAVTMLNTRGPAARRWLLFCVGLTLSYTAAPQLWPDADDAAVTRYEETVAVHRFIEAHIDGRALKLWYRLQADTKVPVRSIASTYLWGYSIVNENLPALTPNEASSLNEGTRLVLLMPAAADADMAREALRRLGRDLIVLGGRGFGAGELAMSVVIGDVVSTDRAAGAGYDPQFRSPVGRQAHQVWAAR